MELPELFPYSPQHGHGARNPKNHLRKRINLINHEYTIDESEIITYIINEVNGMLIRFNVSNFLSFNKMQEFSMIGGKVRSKTEHLTIDNKLKLLKFAAIYGANASGKSNLVGAMDFAKSTIVDGLPEGHTIKYYKNEEENKKAPSYFEFEIKLDNKYYAYGFEIILNRSSIISEWLVELSPDGNDKNIYVRDTQKGIYDVSGYFKNKDNLRRLEIYAEDTKSNDNVLFLSIMNQNKSDLYDNNEELVILCKIYHWVERQLDINYPDKPVSDYSYFATGKNTDEIGKIISAFGTGISKFKVVDLSMDKMPDSLPKSLLKDIIAKLERQNTKLKKTKNEKDIPNGILLRGNKEFFIFEIDINDDITIKTIQFEHSNSSVLFSLSEESDGTRRLLDLIEVLLTENSNKIYVIDEIDRCLHPQLTYKLIESYLKLSKKSQRQLIVTTHESTLLDFELLRRDEIWFVDKNKSGESSVYSLEAYNERFDKKIDKAYLDGRYGGVPIFNSIFPISEE